MLKRILSLFIVFTMVISLVPALELKASAAESGTCGDNLTWTLDDEGTLTISGTGEMYDWEYSFDVPWNSYRKSIKTVKIQSGVTSIGDMAFYYCYILTSVTLPDSVTAIGDDVFLNCDSLVSIEVDVNNSSYTSIDGNLFNKSKTEFIQYAPGKTASVYQIPSSVTIIGEDAFYECSNLTSITIPYSVTTINCVFEYCDNLTGIIVDENNPSFTSIDGNLFNKSKTKLILYAAGKTASSYTVPDGVSTIGDNAFSYCDNLSDITIADSVTEIGDSAFRYCDSLTGITIPDSVTTIGDDAFADCRRITGITIPDSVKTIGDSAFSFCRGLTSAVIGDGVINIGDRAFSYCDSLKAVILGNSVITIGGNAFYSCDTLANITIPDSVTTIGDNAFENCNSLIGVTLGNGLTTIGDSAFSFCDSITSVMIPDSVTTIKDFAFAFCGSLTSVTVGKGVTNIGDRAFAFCDGLTSIDVDKSNLSYISIAGNLFNKSRTELIQYAIGNTASEYTVPNSVTTIGDYAFSHCAGLTSVKMGDSVTKIGSSAFSSCESLENIAMSDSLATINGWAFSNCISLTSITIPDGITAIEEYTFNSCESMKSVTMGCGVTRIETCAFEYCDSITDVYYAGTEDEWSEISIVYGNKNLTNANIHYRNVIVNGICGDSLKWSLDDEGTLIVGGTGAMDDWSGYSSTPWNQYTDNISEVVIKKGVTHIGSSAFALCRSLTDVSIADSVSSIGKNAFVWCQMLTEITIPEGVTTIEQDTFSSCGGLVSVVLPKTITTISDFAFSMCSNLEDIKIPQNVSYIGSYAFQSCVKLNDIELPDAMCAIEDCAFARCSGIENVVIPDSITHIGDFAFYDCTGLSNVYYTGTEDDWLNVTIGSSNEALSNATIYYNCIISPDIISNAVCQCVDGVISSDITFSKLEESGTLYMAVYDDEGSLYSLAEAPVTPGIMEYTLSTEAAEGEQRVKLFCIDSSVIMPLGKAYDCGVIGK